MAGSSRLDEALHSAASRLRAVSENPRQDAQILLADVLNRERSWLLAHPEFELDLTDMRAFERAVGRVEQGEALPYVVGERWFFGRLFAVNPSVLIPRPETELLVEMALDYLRENTARHHAIDVGTGSGCIAVTLCAELQEISMIATDRSRAALDVACANAEANGVGERIDFIQGDLLKPLITKFDLICANLPYIPSGRLASLEVARREPQAALDGGREGLDLISRLLLQAKTRLSVGGRMILEIDEAHGDQAMALAKSIYAGWTAEVHKDLAGLDRVLVIHKDS